MAIMLISSWLGFSMVFCLALLSAASRRLPLQEDLTAIDGQEELAFALARVDAGASTRAATVRST
jgi:hypothetical protein